MNGKTGALYVVATPIGNLQDFTPRALATLNSVDAVLVEDTRHAKKLFMHYGIKTPMRAYHEHNERDVSKALIDDMQGGASYALITDAGTPLMSDPGYVLITTAQARGIQAQTVPGACALVAALSVAGLPTDRFVFEGFLPAKKQQRDSALAGLLSEHRTLVFYESKHRILASLLSFSEVFGADRKIALCRELTKKFETVYAGTVSEVLAAISGDSDAQKGEYVLCVAGAKNSQHATDYDAWLSALLQELPVKSACKIVAQVTGASKNELYERALQLKSD